MSSIQEFNDIGSMNDRIMAQDNKVIKRFWSLDNQTYQAEALDVRTRNAGSGGIMVLRCDDCIKYHLQRCHEEGLTTEEVFEVPCRHHRGRPICIPHT